MKLFLFRMTLFCLIIIGSFAIGEILVRQIDNPYSVKMKLIKEQGENTETILLGNSHTFYGLRADLWPNKAINLSNVSQPLAYDRRIIEKYIDSLPNLKNIVMQVSLTSLFDNDMENTDEWWRCTSYQLYMDLGVHPRFSRYSFEISYLPLYSNKIQSLLHLTKPQLVADSLGNGLGYDAPLPDSELEESGPKIANGHKKSSDMARTSHNLAHLVHISKLCKDRGINLILYTQPEYKSYRSAADPVFMNKMRDVISKFADQYNASYFFLYDDPRFKREDFYDADHLNHYKGAVKLTTILSDTISKTLSDPLSETLNRSLGRNI